MVGSVSDRVRLNPIFMYKFRAVFLGYGLKKFWLVPDLTFFADKKFQLESGPHINRAGLGRVGSGGL